MCKNEKTNKLRAEEIDSKRIFDTAHSFLLAAQRCNEPPIEVAGWSHALLVPIIVNTAFSCELFFKALHHKNGGILEKEHCLYKLFFALPDTTQNTIRQQLNDEKFEEKLKKIANVFQSWRYIYEQTISSIQLGFLFELAHILYDITKKELQIN